MPNSKAKEEKPGRRRGPIVRRYSEKLEKWLWGLDIRVSDGAGRKKRVARAAEALEQMGRRRDDGQKVDKKESGSP